MNIYRLKIGFQTTNEVQFRRTIFSTLEKPFLFVLCANVDVFPSNEYSLNLCDFEKCKYSIDLNEKYFMDFTEFLHGTALKMNSQNYSET